jgi:hypothetical protein
MSARWWLPSITSVFVVGGILVAGGADEPPVPVARLPLAMGEPPCGPDQSGGSEDILWIDGTRFATPRAALSAAWIGNDLGDPADFSGRYVRVGRGPNATLGYEFTLDHPDGTLWIRALAIWQSDGGWLVSGHDQCYVPNRADRT